MARLAAVTLVVLALSAVAAGAQDRRPGILITVRTDAGFPLPPDGLLFQAGGAVAAGIQYTGSMSGPLSAGMAVAYSVSPAHHVDLGYLGTLSVISAEATAELRLTLHERIDLFLSGGAGYFYAFRNEQPSSWMTDLAWSARVGAGVRSTPVLRVGLEGEYRMYRSLFHLMGLGLVVELRLAAGG